MIGRTCSELQQIASFHGNQDLRAIDRDRKSRWKKKTIFYGEKHAKGEFIHNIYSKNSGGIMNEFKKKFLTFLRCKLSTIVSSRCTFGYSNLLLLSVLEIDL